MPERSAPSTGEDLESTARFITQGDGMRQRRAMAKAITLIESTRPDHREQADALLGLLMPATGRALRIGLSGVPGVGKSTLIEALGLYVISQGHRVAVLAVDPSSSLSGGSILGDKTRMEHLSVHAQAFIRPSPSSGTLGGVAEKTREAMLVCEAAGYDVILVETVGVGQSETAVADMTDIFVLMQLPNAGDDLQAIKRGVMELADLVLINKADLDRAAATRAQAQITSSLRLLGMHGHTEDPSRDTLPWQPRVMQLSALQGMGIDELWQLVLQFQVFQRDKGFWQERRQRQSLAWMWERIEAGLRSAFHSQKSIQQALSQLTREVSEGRVAASSAARTLLALHAAAGAAASPGASTTRSDR